MRRERLWRWWTAGGATAVAAYVALPVGGTALYDLVALTATVAVLAAVRLHRPDRPAMWLWFAGGMAMSVAGDLILQLGGPADAAYLAAYPMYMTALVHLLRRRRGRGFTELLDAAIVATGLGVAFFVLVLHPILATEHVTLFERWISTTYPAFDILLLAMLARLLTGAAGRTAATRLLTLAAALLLAADVAFSRASLHSGDPSRLIKAILLLSLVCAAAAALHPSITARAADLPAVPDVRARFLRLGLFTASAMLIPVLLLMPGVGAAGSVRRAVAIGAIVVFLLVLARLAGFMAQVRRQAGELERLAMSDDLTGLANRRRLELNLREMPAGRRPQVALLGLNGFKGVNDELGRAAADQVLVALAGRLTAAAPGALIARSGGDEFAVLLADATAADLALTSDLLVAALRSPVTADGREVLVGVSIGLAGGVGIEPAELLRQAEAAMHAAKRTGDPACRWSSALDRGATAHAQLGAEMRAALDQGQFRLVYQPIVDLPTGRVPAVEALVRWEHPDRGLVSPIDFVPVAEQNGLIVELGEWILRTACLRLAGWRAELGADAPERVSVNVSAKQLARPGFAATVAAVLAETGLPAHCLTVEVTETAVFEGGQAVTALHELRALGTRIALDDFGTGHSSIGLLQTVPVTTIKVDKSFVDDITSAGRQTVIAEALLRLSSGLGLTAVAEGVETAEQAAALSRLGYRYLQGYHYGRPVADPDFALVRAVMVAPVEVQS